MRDFTGAIPLTPDESAVLFTMSSALDLFKALVPAPLPSDIEKFEQGIAVAQGGLLDHALTRHEDETAEHRLAGDKNEPTPQS